MGGSEPLHLSRSSDGAVPQKFSSKINSNLLLSKRLPEGVFFYAKKFQIFRHIRNAKIKFQNKEEKRNGRLCIWKWRGNFEKGVISSKFFADTGRFEKGKKTNLDMVELTFRIRLDATNKSSIMEINEGSDSWDEENTLEILAYLAPYITEGRFVYFNEDEREYWRYVYVPLSEKWKRQEGQITYEKGIETRGHGKIILKEENTPGDRFNIQCDIEDAIQELNINITFYSDRCRGEDIIYLYEEEREIWNEEKTLKFLNLFNPYIKEGIIEYYGDKYPWNYQFNSATATWKKQDGWIIPSSETQIKPMSKDNHEQIFTIEDVLSVTGGNTKVKLVGYEGEIAHCVWTGNC